MIQDRDLSGVLEANLCIGCGACAVADPSIRMVLDPTKLMYEPSQPGGHRAAAVCPAIRVDFEALQASLFPQQDPTPYGVLESVWLAQSIDGDRNRKASSGGIIKELLRELLSRPEVDGAIALRHEGGLDFRPALITSEADVDRLPGSIYHSLPQDGTLRLLQEHEGRFVVVGIPCQLEGLYNYIFSYEPALLDRIYMTIGLLCGWQYTHHSIRAVCDFKGVDPDTIEAISYRGEGPVGKLRLEADGKETAVSRRVDFAYQVAFDRHFNTPRCHLCINHHNMLADVVVGDAWLPDTVFTRTGISLVINRTLEAERLLGSLVDGGRIRALEVTVDELEESQKPGVLFGDFAYAYMDYLDEIGAHRPEMSAQNKLRARPRPRAEVEAFHRELQTKLQLQWAKRYRRLRWRKATKELPRLVKRYWDWFLVRILRAKSFGGARRREIPRDKLNGFR